MKNKRILVIGAVPHPDDLKSYGGATTLMQNFLDYCDEHRYRYLHIDTLKYRNKFINLVHFSLFYGWGILTSDIIMYNASVNGAFTLFYHTAPIAYFFGKKVVFRKFGGNFLNQLRECGTKKRLRMMELLNKASLIYFETKEMMREAPNLFKHPERIHWFPNCRKPSGKNVRKDFSKRFVFISRMEEEKGVDYLINVADTLPEDYTIHLYGPLIKKEYGNPDYFKGRKAAYRGALKTEGVLSTLKEYDVLVLPSHWQTEGYPGILIEAMSVGMPIIASRIGGIPEMVEDNVNGLLIEPHDEDGLRKAILSINKENYHAMASCSTTYFEENYNSDVINENVYRTIMSL